MMTGICRPAVLAANETLGSGETTELVKGSERLLLKRIMPLVRRQSVSLDLQSVTRIDAAGLTALIKLYCAAREADHGFTVSNPSPHVAEILALVGLDRLLVSRGTADPSYSGTQLEETAA